MGGNRLDFESCSWASQAREGSRWGLGGPPGGRAIEWRRVWGPCTPRYFRGTLSPAPFLRETAKNGAWLPPQRHRGGGTWLVLRCLEQCWTGGTSFPFRARFHKLGRRFTAVAHTVSPPWTACQRCWAPTGQANALASTAPTASLNPQTATTLAPKSPGCPP